MTEVSEHNITGVEEFDHSRFATRPEYHALSKAMDAMVKAMADIDLDDEFTQRDWLAMAQQQAAALPYADSCEKCVTHEEGQIVYPYRTRIEGNWLTGTYRCPRCQRRWDCGYAVNVPVFDA